MTVAKSPAERASSSMGIGDLSAAMASLPQVVPYALSLRLP